MKSANQIIDEMNTTPRQTQTHSQFSNDLADPQMPDSCICGGTGWYSLNVPPGHPHFARMWPCACQAGALSERLQAISGLSARERQIHLVDILKRGEGTNSAIRAATIVLGRRSGFLTLWGGSGNGKTHILQAVVNEALSQSMKAIYVTFIDLADWIRDAYNEPPDKTTAHQRLLAICSAHVLCIDEIDKVKESEWTKQFRSDLFDKRYRAALDGVALTLFAMNKNPEIVFDDMDWLLSRLMDGRFAIDYKDNRPVPAIIENRDSDIRPYLRANEAGK